MKIKNFAINLGAAFLAVTGGILAANQTNAHHIDLGWESSPNNLELDRAENFGKEYNFECLPAPTEISGYFYGTNNYSSDSYICPAAVHAGVINRYGGFITIKMNPGQQFYTSTDRNGLTSRNYGTTDFSYTFVGEPVASKTTGEATANQTNVEVAAAQNPAQIPEIGWQSSVENLGLDKYTSLNRQFTFQCTPAPSSFTEYVYGTDNYNYNSSICPAAVHAGIISRYGGNVTIQVNQGQELYAATERNGINSRNDDASEYSFFFIGNPVVDNSTQSPAPAPSRSPGAIEEGARRGIEQGVEEGVKDALRGLF